MRVTHSSHLNGYESLYARKRLFAPVVLRIAADLRIAKGAIIISAADIERAHEPIRHFLDGYRHARV